jgi:hypothetical protein
MGDSTPSIGSLFASGEAGLALDVEAAYLRGWIFQDSAGATVAAAAGDPVGLILDTARGGLDNLGSELVTNGDFSTSDVSAWSAAGNVTAAVTGGVYSLTADAATTGGRFLEATTSSNAVLVTFRARRVSGTSAASYWGIPRTGGFASPNHQVSLDTSGNWVTYRYIILRESGATGVRIYLQLPAGNAVWEFDDVSIKAVPGNHAYQTTSGSRPALARTPDGGRRNLLTCSEKFDDAAWTKLFSSVTANNEAAPDGTTTADLMVEDSTTNGRYLQQSFTTTVQSYTFSCYFKQPTLNARRYVLLYHNESVKGWVFDIQNGVVGAGGTSGVTAPAAYTITSVGNGWYRCAITITGTAASNQFRAYIVTHDGTGGLASYAGNGSGSMLVWGAQVETGSTATAYQRVGLTSDVTESGKRDCWGLLFDGSDDSLQTSEISFNTWTQATRRNLLTDTESFGVAGWVKTSTTVTDNTVISPDGTTTADSLNGSGAGSLSRVVYQNITRAVPATFSVYAKKGTSDFIQLLTDQANNGFVNFDLNNGTLSATTATGTITDVGNGWYRCSMAITSGSTFGNIYIGLVTSNSAARYEANTLTTTVYLWGAQLEAGTLTDYQRVGTDKMTVMAGVRKNSDAAVGMIVELTASLGGNNGSFAMFTPNTAAATTYSFGSRGSTAVIADSSSGFAAPLTSVATLQANIASDSVLGRLNSVQVATSSSDQGSGNYSNAIVYIGSRGGSSFRFNGILYTLIIRGATTPTGTIADFEKNLLRLRAGMGAF